MKLTGKKTIAHVSIGSWRRLWRIPGVPAAWACWNISLSKIFPSPLCFFPFWTTQRPRTLPISVENSAGFSRSTLQNIQQQGFWLHRILQLSPLDSWKVWLFLLLLEPGLRFFYSIFGQKRSHLAMSPSLFVLYNCCRKCLPQETPTEFRGGPLLK